MQLGADECANYSDMRATLQYERDPLLTGTQMVTQNPNRLRTNRPGGSLILGGDTTVNRLGLYGVNRSTFRVLSAC